jgi:hypothetical protein
MKKKWTNRRLFNAVIEQLKAAGKYPGIVDYDSQAFAEHELDSIEVSCVGRLSPGSSEGIYIRLWLEDYDRRVDLGTVKTLREDHEGWMTMAAMMAELQWQCREFIWEHREEIEGKKEGE